MSSWRFCPQCGSPLEWGEMAGAERQLCFAPGCGFVRWDNPLPVVAAVIECVDRDGAILLARNHAWPDKMFALVTGFLERGETPEAAVAREVMEEVALEAVSVKLLGAYPFARKNEIIIGYHVQARGEIRLNEELAEYRLVRPEQLRPWPQATGLAVRDWMLARGMVVPEIAESILTIDGVRVEYADGFGLARPSNTTPVVVLRFEADNEAAIARIQADFRRAIEGVWPGVQLPF